MAIREERRDRQEFFLHNSGVITTRGPTSLAVHPRVPSRLAWGQRRTHGAYLSQSKRRETTGGSTCCWRGIDVEEARGAWRASITASATQHHGWNPQTPMSSGREALPSRICAAGVADAMIMTYTCAVYYHPDDAVGIRHSTRCWLLTSGSIA